MHWTPRDPPSVLNREMTPPTHTHTHTPTYSPLQTVMSVSEITRHCPETPTHHHPWHSLSVIQTVWDKEATSVREKPPLGWTSCWVTVTDLQVPPGGDWVPLCPCYLGCMLEPSCLLLEAHGTWSPARYNNGCSINVWINKCGLNILSKRDEAHIWACLGTFCPG